MNLNEMRDEAYATSKSKGWYEQGRRDIPTLLCLIHSEVSEALEAWRETGDDGIKVIEEAVADGLHERGAAYALDGGPGSKPEGVAAELADVIIRIGDLCGAYGIDLDAAVKAKMTFNKTRPHRHGGKKV
jgi:NTP pyrophosphatase (non-canonical NTP hydrolase)